MIRVRPATTDADIEAWIHVRRVVLPDESGGTVADQRARESEERLLLLAELDGELVVAVVPVTGRLDLKALARAFGGSKAAMAEPKAAERATGYVTGGISPVSQKRALRTVVDETAAAYDVVHVSAGRRGLDLGIAPADLVAATGAITADVSRS